jgi:hypothetical protein
MTTNNEIKRIRQVLEDHEKRIRALEQNHPSSSPEVVSPKSEASIDALARKTGTDPDNIRKLFEIKEDTLTLSKVVGKDQREQTRDISLLVLLGYKYFSNKEEVLAGEMRRNVAENGVPVDNFARYLNEMIPSLVHRKGKSKSHKITYKLSPLGEARAREALKKVCG